ncbi:hypothetical protein BU17DRAFT_78719 [Hysterangium stoloniferum]|nr:hypothetical protein BU17DRAFT_78719 [Hysterangium stoloniferum]
MTERPFVLKVDAQVTGGTGFLGSHIVAQLLDAGYRVRWWVFKVARFLEEAHSARGRQFEMVEIEDLASADLRDALNGIDAIIHSAFPAPESMNSTDLLLNAVKCTTNILRQGYEHGIRKFVLTSSYQAMIGDGPDSVWEDYTFTDRDWNPATYEAAFDGTKDPTWVYAAAKKLSEKAAWDFASEHDGVDLSTVVPTVLLGPFAPGHAILSAGDLSTNVLLYSFITSGPPPHPVWPYFVDVRDAATAHIQALEAPAITHSPRLLTDPDPNSPHFSLDEFSALSLSDASPFSVLHAPPPPGGGRTPNPPGSSHPNPLDPVPIKRFIISGASFTWPEVISHLRMARPDLSMRGQLPDATLCMSLPPHVAKLDTTWSAARSRSSSGDLPEWAPAHIFGSDWKGIDVRLRDWRETVEDAVRDLEGVMETVEQSGWDDLFDDDRVSGIPLPANLRLSP